MMTPGKTWQAEGGLRVGLAALRSLKRRRASLGLALFATVALLLGTMLSRGQNSTATNDAVVQHLENQVDRFLGVLADGQVDDAFDDLLAGSPALRASASVGELKLQTKEIEERFGRNRGYERLSGHRIGQDIVILKYLYKCENYPVVWYFTFYRTLSSATMVPPTPTWRLISLRFDTQVELLDLTQ
jgi:hypothetical protein